MTPVLLEDGEYRLEQASPTLPSDSPLQGLVVAIEGNADSLSFLLADGSHFTTHLNVRERSDWMVNCETELSQVADISPAPLALPGLALQTPIVRTGCGPTVIVMANTAYDDGTPLLVFGRVPR